MIKTVLMTICAAAMFFTVPCLGQGSSYAVAKTLKVGGEGGWDYVTVGSGGQLLYLTRSNHMMIVQTSDGQTVADIPGGKREHGVALAENLGRGFITDGGAGQVIVFDLKTHAVLGKIAAAEDADGIIFDPSSNRVLVACGDAGQLIAIDPVIDPTNGKAEPPVDLGGKPEFLAADGHGKVYVNLVDKDMVAVVDLSTMKIVNRWPVAPGSRPTGLAIDPASGYLFVGCRNRHLIVMSTKDGHIAADLPIGNGNDACAFDPGIGDIFASCGDGTLSIARQTAPGQFAITQTLVTRAGARTLGLDPTTHAAYLPTADAQPGRSGRRPSYKPGSFMVLIAMPQESR